MTSRYSTLALATFSTLSLLSPAFADEQSVPEEIVEWANFRRLASYAAKEIEGTYVALSCEYDLVYIPRNITDPLVDSNSTSFGVFFHVVALEGGKLHEPLDGYIPVGGKPQQAKFSANNPQVIEIHDDGNASFRGPGDATLTATIAGEKLSVRLRLVEVPFKAGTPDATPSRVIIETIGLPDQKTDHAIAWPGHEIIDGQYYSADPGEGFQVSHWKYNAYPGLVLVFRNYSDLQAVRTYSPKGAPPAKLEDQNAPQAAGPPSIFGSPVAEKKEEQPVPAVVMADSPAEEPVAEEPKKLEPVVRTFTDSTGGFSIEAEVLGIGRKLVLLRYVESGKEVAVPVERFSQEDQAWLDEARRP